MADVPTPVLAINAYNLFAFGENFFFWSQVVIFTLHSSYFGSASCFEDQLADVVKIVSSLYSLDLRDILDVQRFKLGQITRIRCCKQGGRLTIREIRLNLQNVSTVCAIVE